MNNKFNFYDFASFITFLTAFIGLWLKDANLDRVICMFLVAIYVKLSKNNQI